MIHLELTLRARSSDDVFQERVLRGDQTSSAPWHNGCTFVTQEEAVSYLSSGIISRRPFWQKQNRNAAIII